MTTKKLNIIKTVLRIVISCFVILNCIKSCARATVNVTQLTEDLNKLLDKGIIGRFPSGTNWGHLTASGNFVGYYILVTGNSGSYSNKLIIGTWLVNINSNIVNYPNQQWWGYYRPGYSYPFNTISYCFELTNGSSSTEGNLSLNDANIIYAYTTRNIRTDALTLDAGEEYGQNIINQRFEFVPSGQVVTFEGDSVNAIKQDFLVLPFSLGNIVDRDLYHNFLISISTNGTTIDSLNYYNDYNENSNKNYHQGMLSVNLHNNNVYIQLSSARLNHNQKYTLSIDAYTDSIEHEVYTYDYVFLYENASVSGGVITSSGSGDFSNQEVAINDSNNTNNLIESITGVDESFSISSGDFPTYEVSDPTVNFFEYLITRLSTLFLENEPVNLNIKIPYLLSSDYVLNSDFFVLSGPLLLFLHAFILVWIIVPKFNEVNEVIKLMQMGYTDSFINHFGYGISINELL